MFGNIDIMHKVIQWYMRKHEECTRDHASVFENIPIMYQGVCYFFLGGGGIYVIHQEVCYLGGGDYMLSNRKYTTCSMWEDINKMRQVHFE